MLFYADSWDMSVSWSTIIDVCLFVSWKRRTEKYSGNHISTRSTKWLEYWRNTKDMGFFPQKASMEVWILGCLFFRTWFGTSRTCAGALKKWRTWTPNCPCPQTLYLSICWHLCFFMPIISFSPKSLMPPDVVVEPSFPLGFLFESVPGSSFRYTTP